MNEHKKNTIDSKEQFLKKYEHINLRQDLERVEKIQPEFWQILEEIRDHYKLSLDNYKSKLRSIIDKISDEDMNNPVIHSIRYRIKDPDSLIVKIIQKSAKIPEFPQNSPEIEKYRNITKNNYYKVITDLIGVRILIRYRYQWKTVHSLIWKLFKSAKDEYIEDWIKDYKNDPAIKYIVEKPKAYVKQDHDRITYEEIGKNIFDIKKSDDRYASIHYVINLGGSYCEIQVRTILDEAWCECNHDFVYKANTKSTKDKNILESLSVILSQQTTAAESTVALMCNLATGSYSKSKSSSIEYNDNNNEEVSLKSYSEIQKRAGQLSNSDAFIDSILRDN